MEPGTLELQIFVSLIVILGTAFIALVCDYLKGNNESLREHNIELRVRKEEQDKNQPLEAVQRLQHPLDATDPIRLGGERRGPRREAGVGAGRHAEHVPGAASNPAAVGSLAKNLSTPGPKSTQQRSRPSGSQPAAAQQPKEAVSEPLAEVAGERRMSQVQARRQVEVAITSQSLLETLPKPAWLRKEQEAKAAARALREREEDNSKRSGLSLCSVS